MHIFFLYEYYSFFSFSPCQGLPIIDDGNGHSYFCALRLLIGSHASDQLKLKPDYCLQPALNWNWNLPIHIQSARASATSGLRRRRHLRGTGALDWFCTNISTKVAILCTLVRKEDKNFNFFPWGTGIKKGNYCRLSYPKRRRRKSCRWPQGCCL